MRALEVVAYPLPQFVVDVDRSKVKALDVNLGDVFSTLQAALGSVYVNDFNKFGYTFQVRAQADTRFRMEPQDVGKLTVKNRAGKMIPLGSLVEVRPSSGPSVIGRYNMYPVASISGAAAPGASSGDALKTMESIARKALPPTFWASPSESVFVSVVCSIWPWKSFSPMIEIGLYAFPPLRTSSRTRPWLCCGSAIPSMNASVGARSIVRAVTWPFATPSPPARNVARMLTFAARSWTAGT